ncbi:hypothetical protein HIDPHFAB_04845 [Nocardioides sp. T2.26MG-1]|nr:hypothetical protein HIDPHFAB_04845 [Nocardioides sp. T2.26MG-1]
MYVRGKAVTGGGKVLKRHDIAVFLHKRDQPLGGGKTSRTGAFSIKICRSSTLASVARRHTGRLNVDVLTHLRGGNGPWYMRIAAGHYSKPTITIPKGFVAAKVTDETVSARPSARGGGTVATGVAATDTVLRGPGLMFVQAARYMEANYTIKSSSVNSIKAVIGVDKGGYKAAGEIAIEGVSTFESGKVLKATRAKPRRAILVRPELAVTSQYTCYHYNPYFGGSLNTGKCVTESSGEWTGEVNKDQARFQGCNSGRAHAIRFTNRDQKYLKTSEGVTYSSTVSAGALGSSLAVTASYGSETGINVTFNQGGKVHRFCSGGNAETIAKSSALYVDFVPPPAEPCQPHRPCHG